LIEERGGEPGGETLTPPDRDPRSYTPRHLADRILTTRSALEGEHKQVTVLFCDIAGSSALATRLGPESMHRLLSSFFELALNEVHRYEGTINQFEGDGFMALFGAPIACEDHARRAVLAALGIQRGIREGEVDSGPDGDLAVRAGLNTGLVVVGAIGDNLRMDYTAVGDTTILARRMEQAAETGTVYLSEHTHSSVQDYFDCEPVVGLAVKGRDRPSVAYRVVGMKGIRTRIEAAVEHGLTPFVGRDQELAVLEGYCAHAVRGQGQVVFLSGEPGIGKSRLLLEFRRSTQAQDIRWLEGHCISYGSNTPYLPVIEIVKDAFGIEEGDDDGRIIQRVDEGTAGWEDATRGLPAYLKYLLSVDPGDPAVTAMEPRERRAGIFGALRALLLQEGRIRPLVVVVEDLHWIDEQSEEALAALTEVIASAPVLLILSYRPGYTHSLGERTYYSRLALGSLAPEESSSILEAVLRVSAFPPELAELVMRKTEGNPFFIEEVTKSLVESGVLKESAGAYRLERPVADLRIPDTIQEVILSRIDRLEQHEKEALQLASVIGREFTVRVLNRISDLETSLDEVLTDLRVLELIYQKAYFPETAYMFKHALTQDVAYSTLLSERRKALHRIIGAAIEELYRERLAEHYETLAYHYTEGENWEKALDYLYKAGEKAKSNYANREAIAQFSKGLGLLRGLPETPERRARELEYLIAVGVPLIFTKGHGAAQVGEVYTRARDLGERVGDSSLYFQALVGLRRYHFANGELISAHEKGETLLELAERDGKSHFRARALMMLGETAFWRGDFVQTCDRAQSVTDLFAKRSVSGQVSRYGTDSLTFCHLLLGLSLTLLGHLEKGVLEYDEALRIATELGHPINRMVVSMMGAIQHQLLLETETTRKLAEEIEELSTDLESQSHLPVGLAVGGWMELREGDFDNGVQGIDKAQEMLKVSGMSVLLPYFLYLLADAFVEAGKCREAMGVLNRLKKLIRDTDGRFVEAEAYRLEAECVLGLGETTEQQERADRLFRKALGVARRQQARLFELRAAMGLSLLMKERGKSREAHALLQEAYGWFTEGFERSDLKQAKAVLDQL
jgi:class 3 adenylate cyclase/tetratricopeptide (TPR) repeat protein